MTLTENQPAFIPRRLDADVIRRVIALIDFQILELETLKDTLLLCDDQRASYIVFEVKDGKWQLIN